MKQFTLLRVSSEPLATRGVILVDGAPICVTLELPWKDNQAQISCIPEGIYDASWYLSPSHGETILFQNVPGRSLIMFHSANTPDQLKGCVAPGCEFGIMDDQPAVFKSKLAMGKLKAAMYGERQFKIEVKRA